MIKLSLHAFSSLIIFFIAYLISFYHIILCSSASLLHNTSYFPFKLTNSHGNITPLHFLTKHILLNNSALILLLSYFKNFYSLYCYHSTPMHPFISIYYLLLLSTPVSNALILLIFFFYIYYHVKLTLCIFQLLFLKSIYFFYF